MRLSCALALVLIVAACRKSDDASLRSDSAVTPPVSADTLSHAPADNAPLPLTCGITGKPVMTDNGIGELRVGRTVDQIRESCEVITDSDELGSEGMKERVVVTRIGGESVRAVITNDKVWRIEVLSPRIRTPDSLGVDTPLHKIATRRGARFFPGEDGVYGFVADHCAMSFRFSVPMRPPRGSDWTAQTIDKAHGDAAVNKVLITQCRT